MAFSVRIAALTAITVASSAMSALQVAPVPADILTAMKSANDYFMKNNAIGNCDWERGTYYDGATQHYNVSSDPAALAFILDWANTWNYTCSDGSPAYDYDANKQASGHSYARLYETFGGDYRLAMGVTLERQIATQPNTLWNWLDALFMAMPTFMKYGALIGDTKLWDAAWSNYQWTAFTDSKQPNGVTGLWSPADGLFFRDATYFNKTAPNGKKVFWSRGNGWAISAMAESIEALPVGHKYAAEFTSKLQTMAASLLPLQNTTDGMWRSSLLDAEEFANPETTGSAMFTYGIAWGVRNGLLDAATYTPAVYAAWNGLVTVALQTDGLVGWCQPANGQPASTTQNATSDFCVGQFLMAGAEVYRLVTTA